MNKQANVPHQSIQMILGAGLIIIVLMAGFASLVPTNSMAAPQPSLQPLQASQGSNGAGSESFIDWATSTPTSTPTATPTATPTNTPVCSTENLCSFIRSAGFWKNYSNQMSDAQFMAILGATQDYAGLSLSQALAILNDTADQYHRNLLSAELNAVWNGNTAPGGPLASGIYNNPAYPSSSLNGKTIQQINHIAYTTDPSAAGADLNAYVNYLGAGGEFDSGSQCLVQPANACPKPDLAVDKSFETPSDRTVLVVGESVTFNVVTTNTGQTTIAYLPLTDLFDKSCLTHDSKNASPPENVFNNAAGTIQWYDLTVSNGQDLAPTRAFTTMVTFQVTGPSAAGFNTASVSGALDEYNQVVPNRQDTVQFTCVDARISITPGSATNDVGQLHTFTVTVEKNLGGGWVPASGVFPVVTISPTPDNKTDNCATSGTDANGQCTVIINSNSVRTFTAHAAADVNINGAIVHRETTGSGGNSGDAAKTYVDARITLTPLSATNKVGDAHVITATVQQNAGSGWGAAAGKLVTFSLPTNTAGATFVGGVSTCTTNASGVCTVTITASAAGQVTAQATSTFTVGGVSLTRTTGVSAGSSANAAKTYVDARITLTPLSATNKVGDAHIITATVQQNAGSGWGAAAGKLVTFSLPTNTAGATFVGGVSTCTTNASGVCSVTITTNTAGQVTAQATSTFTVGGVSLTRTTGISAGSSANAAKTYVDARITLTPLSATNKVGDAHIITATVQQNDGNSWAAAAGKLVTFSLPTNTAGATFVGGVSTCTTNASGVCSVTITASAAGQVTAQATSTFTVGGVSLTRTTGVSAGSSANAAKTYVDARITLTPLTATNKVGDAHIITATVQQNDGNSWAAAAGKLVTFSLPTNTAGATFVGGVSTCTTNASGVCSVTITASAAGQVTAQATSTFTVGGVSLTRTTGISAGSSANAAKTYVDARITLTPLSATNKVGDAHIITATVQQNDGNSWAAAAGKLVTFSLPTNTAGATFVGGVSTCTTNASGVCSVTITASAAGQVTAQATSTFTVGGVSLTRTTGVSAGSSANAAKTYVDARITLTPLSATNKVGDAHIITATVQQNDGNSWAAAAGKLVTFSLPTNTAGATFVGGVSTCTTNASGVCSVTITASAAGQVTAQATSTFTVGGVSLTRTTGVSAGSSANAAKTYVDAKLNLSPLQATNQVGDPHTITATVERHNGASWSAAADGTRVDFTLTGNASFVGNNFCLTTGGSCSVTINASVAGVVTIHASTNVNVGGLTLHRETTGTGGNSSDATKTYIATGSIGDYIWNDANGNGQQDEGPGYGINGVTVKLYTDPNCDGNPADGSLYGTRVTAGNGAYNFTSLPYGCYVVDVDESSPALAGYYFIPGAQSGPEPHSVNLAAGQSYTTADFGYAGKGPVSGTVFYDWNQNGAQELLLNETGIPNVEVCLYKDNDGDGQLDIPGDTLVPPCQNTDSQGNYSFPAQLPGKYLVVETQPAGTQSSTANVIPVTLIIVGPSGSATDKDFGDLLFVRLGDFVYVDLNANGQQDVSETIGIGNVQLNITGVNIGGDSVSITVTTNMTGHYLQEGLLPGTYTVTAPISFGGYMRTTQPGWKSTTLTLVITEDLTLDFGYVFPTAVQVQLLTAMASRLQVTLSWQAFGEPAPTFHVWRADNSKGVGAVRLTSQPVAGVASAYQYVDNTVTRGQAYWYWLEEARDGQRYGPQAAMVPQMNIQAYLPAISH